MHDKSPKLGWLWDRRSKQRGSPRCFEARVGLPKFSECSLRPYARCLERDAESLLSCRRPDQRHYAWLLPSTRVAHCEWHPNRWDAAKPSTDPGRIEGGRGYRSRLLGSEIGRAH